VRISERATRVLAVVFLATTVALAVTLGLTWRFMYRLSLATGPAPAPMEDPLVSTAPVSPLLLHYQLDVPGRGEIFPALANGKVQDYWPVAMLTIANTSDRPALQTVSSEIMGWSRRSEQTLVVGARETRKVRLSPDLLPKAYENSEIRNATLDVRVSSPDAPTSSFAQTRTVLLHSAYDLYWGPKFANAQFVARWVTPHDPAVLKLVSEARRWMHRGRFAGYDPLAKTPAIQAAFVREQAEAAFRALQRSGITYVSSIFTFGNYVGQAQRIRLPRETLELSNANCIDVSAVFASVMENIGLEPVIIIVPGHAFAGVRLAAGSREILYVDLTVLPDGTFAKAVARADAWMKKTPPDQVLTVDVAAARALGIYPIPEPSSAPANTVATVNVRP
jgi:hypothetical protein